MWFAGLLFVTLGGRPHDAYGHVFFNWVPFATQSAAHETEIVVNLLLFVPAGLLLAWSAGGVSAARVIGLAAGGAAAVSMGIEVVQTFTPLGTAGDITDVMLNATGCVMAAGLGLAVRCGAQAAGRRPRLTR